MFLAFDPGDKHHGYAEFDDNGKFVMRGIAEGKAELKTILKFYTPNFIIIEDWTLFPGLADKQYWSQMGACRTIGYLERWAEDRNIPVKFQQPSIKDTAYMWAGMKNRHKHDEDAYVHGIYYLITNKLINPATLQPTEA